MQSHGDNTRSMEYNFIREKESTRPAQPFDYTRFADGTPLKKNYDFFAAWCTNTAFMYSELVIVYIKLGDKKAE